MYSQLMPVINGWVVVVVGNTLALVNCIKVPEKPSSPARLHTLALSSELS